MGKPTEHFEKIEHEISWMGLDGHLNTAEKVEAVNEISKAVHKTRLVFEKDKNG